MDPKVLLPHLRAHKSKLDEVVFSRPKAWQAILDNPMIPTEGLPALEREFKSQTLQAHAAALLPIADLAVEVRKAIPPKVVIRPKDAAENIRVGAEVQELQLRTGDGLVSRIDQASEEGDWAFVARALPVLGDMQTYKKPLQMHMGLASALARAKQHLAALPEVVARNEAIAFADEIDIEVNLLGHILTSRHPTHELELYTATGSFKHLAPVAETATGALPSFAPMTEPAAQ